MYITAYSLCSVPLLTMAAISVGRFLALLSGLRYRQIQCNFRARVLHGSNLLGTVWRRWFMLLDYRIDTKSPFYTLMVTTYPPSVSHENHGILLPPPPPTKKKKKESQSLLHYDHLFTSSF